MLTRTIYCMKSKIYYDDDCYVCSLEINAIRERGEKCGIEFVDISAPGFGPNGKEYETEMIGEFDGLETKGPETFRKCMRSLALRNQCCLQITRSDSILDFGYYVFAYAIRPNLPKRNKK